MDLSWLEQFLPMLRCPASQQPLRWATPEERGGRRLRLRQRTAGMCIPSATASRFFCLPATRLQRALSTEH